MHILGGIDEVGYGSRLGPLVLVSTLFEVPDPSIDLWRALSSEISRARDGRRLPVCDSKELFTQSRGPGVLEPTALGFLQLDPSFRGLSLRELSERLAHGCTEPVPWFRGRDGSLPEVATRDLAATLRKAGVRLRSVRARFLEATEFNEQIDRTGNKNRLHFEAVADLIEPAFDEFEGHAITMRVGKLSGRTFYLRNLQERFNLPVMIRAESRARSTYQMSEGVSVSFIRDGDRTDFAIALSSIIAKYLREKWMQLFNAYWLERVEKIRPTAGYGRDANRFFGEIRDDLGGLEEREVYRFR